MTIQFNYFGTWLGGAAAFSQPPNEKLIGSSPLCSCATRIRSCDPHPSGCLIRERIRFKLGLAGVGYTVLAVMEPALQKSTLMRTKGTAQIDTDIIIHTHTLARMCTHKHKGEHIPRKSSGCCWQWNASLWQTRARRFSFAHWMSLESRFMLQIRGRSFKRFTVTTNTQPGCLGTR